MENKIIINSLKIHFFKTFSMLEEIIELCPNKLWYNKISGFIFCQQILHTLYWTKYWLIKEEIPLDKLWENIHEISKMETDVIENITKENVRKYSYEVKCIVEKLLINKDDNWLKMKSEKHIKINNFDIIEMQIKHIMYHIGFCDAIFRENKIETIKYLDYYGERNKE